MAFSTIPAAKSELLTRLKQRPGLAGVLVEWGLGAKLPAVSERVALGDVTNVMREWVALGQRRVNETYTLSIHVEVYQRGDDQRACEERMWEIVSEVELTAISDITLAGVLNWGCKPGAMAPRTGPADSEGWVSFVTLHLDCTARIQPTAV